MNIIKEVKKELLNNKFEVFIAIVVMIAGSICAAIHWPIN